MKTIQDYPVTASYMVHWGDMDAARHVNNLIYLKWAESARLLYFDQMGMDTSFQSSGTGPILGWQECKYIYPMTFPDTAIVGVRTSDIKADRIMLETAIFSKQHQRIACLSRQSIIPYHYQELRKVSLPEAWREAIGKIENGE